MTKEKRKAESRRQRILMDLEDGDPMRFSLFDLVLGCIAGGMGCAGAFMIARLAGMACQSLTQVVAGAIAYFLVTPLIYRALHRRPLLLPRCPGCRDANRHWWTIVIECPVEVVECAVCQTQIELHHASCDKLPSTDVACFEL